MSAPFLWGSRIDLPAGISDSYATPLRNGTLLVVGKVGTPSEGLALKAWIYGADGSLKEEKVLETPAYGQFPADYLARYSSNPFAVELPDGRIALTWSLAVSELGGQFVAWLGIYGGDLRPAGDLKPVAGLSGDSQSQGGIFKADDALALTDGRVVAAYRSEGGQAFLRILGADGSLSSPLSLGSTLPSDRYSDFESQIDLAALANGKVAAAVRTGATENKIYIIDPAAAGSPVVLKQISVPIVAPPGMKSLEVTALEGGGFVVTWVESGAIGGSQSEPDVTAKFQIYSANGTPVRSEPLAFYTSAAEADAVGTPDVVALPGGGFALAAQVVTGTSPSRSEVRLATFTATGERVSDKLLVSRPAAEGEFSLQGLSVLADGRIAAHLSNGIQIVDVRGEAVFLKGTTGSDHYIGTAFNDTFDGSAGADRLDGGAGIDIVSFVNAKAGVTASLSNGTSGDAAGDTYISVEGLLGSSFDDILIGNGSAILKGRGGNDTYFIKAGDVVEEAGNEGRDTVIVGSSHALALDAQIEVLRLEGISSKISAHLTGSNIDNEIVGHAGTNSLKGLGGNDLIKAFSGNDRVYGDAGSDTIHGGTGNDRLYGGSGTGRDVFVFDTKANRSTNVDRIYDFNPKHDAIWLENAIFTKLGKGSTKGVKFKADMFVKGKAAEDKEDRIVYDSKTGALYYDQDGAGSKAQVKIATLNKNLKLAYSDFFVI
jgi:Ca2+-binding RTX toxin-like protein